MCGVTECRKPMPAVGCGIAARKDASLPLCWKKLKDYCWEERKIRKICGSRSALPSWWRAANSTEPEEQWGDGSTGWEVRGWLVGLASGFPGLLFTWSDDANPVCAAFCSVGCMILRAFLMFGVFSLLGAFLLVLTSCNMKGAANSLNPACYLEELCWIPAECFILCNHRALPSAGSLHGIRCLYPYPTRAFGKHSSSKLSCFSMPCSADAHTFLPLAKLLPASLK